MQEVIRRLKDRMETEKLHFEVKPILIGGMAMEYYGMRKSGADIDLVICGADYRTLALSNPDKRRDLWGVLGVMIGQFEIWRSIALLDYDFYSKDAVDEGIALVVSLDRLLFMRVIAMDVEKYRKDLILMKEYYYEHFRNRSFLEEFERHRESYEKCGGVIQNGKYIDSEE